MEHTSAQVEWKIADMTGQSSEVLLYAGRMARFRLLGERLTFAARHTGWEGR